jgi:hypothetical protein
MPANISALPGTTRGELLTHFESGHRHEAGVTAEHERVWRSIVNRPVVRSRRLRGQCCMLRCQVWV